MPTPQEKLATLFASGMSVYPGHGMHGGALGTSVFAPTQQGFVWGGLGAVPLVRSPKQIAAAKRAVAWVQANFPALYDASVRRVGNEMGAGGMRGLGAEGAAAAPTGVGWYDKIMNAFTTIAPEYLKVKAQKDLLAVQMDRARAGLPPLNAAQYAPGVQVSLPPGYVDDAFSSVPKWVWIAAAAALVGVVVLPRLGGSRRR